jgi:transposase
VNIAMGRSHAWVPRGQEYVEPRPTNWGDNLTLIGAMRQDRWLTLGTCWRAMTTTTFVQWVQTRLAPRLRRGDVVLLDNLAAHKSPVARRLIEARGASLCFLPPYSYDYNPIESGWGLIKKRIRAYAPRTAPALRRTAVAARHAVRPHHCRQWFRHAGYVKPSEHRG